MRPEGALVVDKAPTVEDHRLHRMARSDSPPLWGLCGGVINALSDAACLKHPRNKAPVI